MSMTQRLDAFQRRHPAWGFPIAVVYKFVDDQGSYLAALITYYGLVSLFPLLLLLSTVLRLVLFNDAHLQKQVLDSAVGQLPLVGQQLSDAVSNPASNLGLTVGIVGTLYGGLGVGQALQNAMNAGWMVPRNSRLNPLRSRARSLGLLVVLGISVIGTTALSALSTHADSLGARIGMGLQIVAFVAAVLINAAVFVLVFRFATARDVGIREVLPGAMLSTVAWQLLQYFGPNYVTYVAHHSSATTGTFAVVLGLLAWIYLEAMVVVFSVELNVVRALHLYPRALLTPFTDDVDLTEADEASYTRAAKAQRQKGFERIDVTFDDD